MSSTHPDVPHHSACDAPKISLNPVEPLMEKQQVHSQNLAPIISQSALLHKHMRAYPPCPTPPAHHYTASCPLSSRVDDVTLEGPATDMPVADTHLVVCNPAETVMEVEEFGRGVICTPSSDGPAPPAVPAARRALRTAAAGERAWEEGVHRVHRVSTRWVQVAACAGKIEVGDGSGMGHAGACHPRKNLGRGRQCSHPTHTH